MEEIKNSFWLQYADPLFSEAGMIWRNPMGARIEFFPTIPLTVEEISWLKAKNFRYAKNLYSNFSAYVKESERKRDWDKAKEFFNNLTKKYSLSSEDRAGSIIQIKKKRKARQIPSLDFIRDIPKVEEALANFYEDIGFTENNLPNNLEDLLSEEQKAEREKIIVEALKNA